jgi:HPt (histidine-containing phosphotransfer) domain-containing protein
MKDDSKELINDISDLLRQIANDLEDEDTSIAEIIEHAKALKKVSKTLRKLKEVELERLIDDLTN